MSTLEKKNCASCQNFTPEDIQTTSANIESIAVQTGLSDAYLALGYLSMGETHHSQVLNLSKGTRTCPKSTELKNFYGNSFCLCLLEFIPRQVSTNPTSTA